MFRNFILAEFHLSRKMQLLIYEYKKKKFKNSFWKLRNINFC